MMTDISNRSPYLSDAPGWVGGYTAWLPERQQPVRRVGYTLADLVRRNLIDGDAFAAFSENSGLADFAWRLLWADDDDRPDAESIAAKIQAADGLLVFIHGWDGSGEIWEDLPALAVRNRPNLVALVPDVNGFGGSPFLDPSPDAARCDPPAVMASVEAWLDLLEVRPANRVRPVVIVGHSMGGASLFFADPARWRTGELGRVAAAPALLLNDKQRQNFYRALGAGIRLSGISEFIDRLAENVIAPRIIDALAGGGSDRVLAEHRRIYRATPEGVIARTFAAMGQLAADLANDGWQHFRVVLGHRDRLVGLNAMLDLLEEIAFDPAQIRVVLGDHYFFSVGEHSIHARNRELLLADILNVADELVESDPGT